VSAYLVVATVQFVAKIGVFNALLDTFLHLQDSVSLWDTFFLPKISTSSVIRIVSPAQILASVHVLFVRSTAVISLAWQSLVIVTVGSSL